MKKNNSNVQSKNTLMKRNNIKEETKKIKIKIQISRNDKTKVLHKFNSNKEFMEKKYSSINITPKNINHNMNFNSEGPKHKKISSTIVTTSNKKSTTYQKVKKEKITSFTNHPISTVQRKPFSQPQ